MREVVYTHFYNQSQRYHVKTINQQINLKNTCIFKDIEDN